MKPNQLQPLSQQDIKFQSASKPTFYFKTNEPLILTAFKHPMSRHCFIRCATPPSTPDELMDFYENLGRHKASSQTSIYSKIDKQPARNHFNHVASDTNLTASAQNARALGGFEVQCNGLLHVKKLPDISPPDKKVRNIDKPSKEKKINKEKNNISNGIKSEWSSEIANQLPLALKYCTIKDLALKLPIQNKKLVWDLRLKTKDKIV